MFASPFLTKFLIGLFDFKLEHFIRFGLFTSLLINLIHTPMSFLLRLNLICVAGINLIVIEPLLLGLQVLFLLLV